MNTMKTVIVSIMVHYNTVINIKEIMGFSENLYS